MRCCAYCFDPLPVLARADARCCSTRCRVALHRMATGPAEVPAELRKLDRWVRYSATKVPLSVYGGPASSTNAATWGTYDDAVCGTEGVGVGFVLNGDGIVCIDVDDCYNRGRFAPWFVDFASRMPRTYVEVSPSGSGVHIWGTAQLPYSGRKVSVPGGVVEIYGSVRYLTVTGRPLTAARNLAPLGSFVDQFG